MTAKLYVSDYATYNSGSLSGEWLDLDLLDIDDLNKEISNILKENSKKLGETCKEPMFQDFEGFLPCLYGESMNESELKEILEYTHLDEDEKEALDMIIEATGYTYDNAKGILDNGSYCVYTDKNDVVNDWIAMNEVPEHLEIYLDEDYILRTLELDTLTELKNGTYIDIYN